MAALDVRRLAGRVRHGGIGGVAGSVRPMGVALLRGGWLCPAACAFRHGDARWRDGTAVAAELDQRPQDRPHGHAADGARHQDCVGQSRGAVGRAGPAALDAPRRQLRRCDRVAGLVAHRPGRHHAIRDDLPYADQDTNPLAAGRRHRQPGRACNDAPECAVRRGRAGQLDVAARRRRRPGRKDGCTALPRLLLSSRIAIDRRHLPGRKWRRAAESGGSTRGGPAIHGLHGRDSQLASAAEHHGRPGRIDLRPREPLFACRANGTMLFSAPASTRRPMACCA